MEITITDMPKMANVVEGDAATNMQQQDEEGVGAQHAPTSSEQGARL